jgi:hypothetical protein
MGPLLAIDYPARFEARLGSLAAARTWSVAGPADEGDPAAAQYVLVNVGVIWPVVGARDLPPGQVIARSGHPLEFWPYQYEDYRRDERALLRASDISMRLIQTAH